jgi:hypothetical protein
MRTLLKTPSGTGPTHTGKKLSEENEPAVLTVDANGLIRNCNKAAGKIMGCECSKLVWQHVSNVLPQLSETELMQGDHINPRLRFLSRVGHRFQLAIPGGRQECGRIFFNDLENAGRHIIRLIIYPEGQHEFPESAARH